jgi:LPS O-antigen subunit length determinant protein (WzzB/FepE family)
MEMKGSKPEGMAKFFNALVETGIKNIPIKDLLSDAIDQRLKTISSKKEFFLLQEEKKRKMKVLQNKMTVLQNKKKLEMTVLQNKKKFEMTVLQNKKKFEKEISILKEELALARGMKIEGNNFKTDQPLNGAPRWYLYGARILEEELKVLESKAKNNNKIERAQTNSTIEQANLDSDDIKTLNAEIERAQTNSASEQAKFDDALKIWESFKNLKSPTVVVINQASIPPTQPIQTKKAILIFTAMIVGLVLGCFIAIIRDAMRKLKEKEIVFAPAKPDRKFVFEHSSQAANLSRAR